MDTLIIIVTIALYLATTGLLAQRLMRGATLSKNRKNIALFIGVVGAILHASLLYATLHTTEGLNLSFVNVLSLTAWLVIVMILVSSLRQPIENLAIFTLPLAAACLLIQFSFPDKTISISNLSPGLKAHILLSIVSYSLLSIAVVQALLLSVQDRHLRNRHPGGFIRALPPLETMESLLFQMIGLGYIFLSLSLVTGVTYIENIVEQHLIHKTTLSIVAWVVFAILLWGRWRFGWRGRTAIRWTLGGFVVLMLAYFGSKMVLELILVS
jgi:ABC-type uncharacterized transport system permease subunit